MASDKTLIEQGIMKLAKTKGGRFFQNWANNTVHEYAEEGVQAGISSVLESATGKDTTTGQQEFGSLEAAGTTAASVAFITSIFTLAGLGADVDPILTEYEQSNFKKARQMTAEVIDSTIESGKLAQENVSFLNKLKANMVTTETISTDSGDISVQTQNGEIFVPSIVDVDTLAKSNLSDTMVKLLDYANQNKNINVDAAVDSYYEYIAASEEARPEAYQKAVQAVKSSINNAIEILHAKGTDVSSLEQVKSQVEADSQRYEKYARFNYKAQQAPAVKEQQANLVADVEAALTRRSKQNGDLGIDALHDAYYHGYLTGGGDIQPAVKMAMRSIDMALVSSEVAAGDKAVLREMRAQLADINPNANVSAEIQSVDTDGEEGYNTNSGTEGSGGKKDIPNGVAVDSRVIDETKDATLIRRVRELRSVFTGKYVRGNFGYAEVNIDGLETNELY
ncbi:MAG: hypothetical protein VB106_12115, partial [Clostridiaceae bacterium]|nr:hypothetical protein [Clostridiaceae bacterium]